MMWWSIWIYCIPAYESYKWAVSLISPLWITLLLMFVSGIPFLDRASRKKYGMNSSF